VKHTKEDSDSKMSTMVSDITLRWYLWVFIY